MIDLKEAIRKYDSNNKDYKAILYVCLEGGAGEIAGKVEEVKDVAIVKKAIKTIGMGVGQGAFIGAVDGSFSNDFSIMTVNNDYLCFYTLSNLSFKIDNIDNITNKIILPYDIIVDWKVGKTLMWNNIKIYYTINNKKHKLKIVISENVMGLKGQKENIKMLLDILKQRIYKTALYN